MLENVRKNLYLWDQHHDWPRHGDEWDRQAIACGVSYETWRDSLVEHLIAPNVTRCTQALEIGPGHGRWTKYLIESAAHVVIADIGPSCLDYCRERFHTADNVEYFLTPGDRLPPDAGGRIDFIWSFDAFVHMDRQVIGAYLREIRRVLKPQGLALIHHSSVEDLATHRQDGAAGWRSSMDTALFRCLAEAAGLAVVTQFSYWDGERKIGVPRHGDRITHLRLGETSR